jgi:hypothetical protein
MINMGSGFKTGGPKYRENWHNFQGAVAGFSLSGVAAFIILHAVFLNTPQGHAKLMHILGAMPAAK